MKHCIYAKKKYGKIRERIDCYISNLDEEGFVSNAQDVKTKYEITDDKGKKLNKLEDKDFALTAINGLLRYIKDTQKIELENINKIKIYSRRKICSIRYKCKTQFRINRKNEG